VRLIETLLRNHPLANICFVIVLALGTLAYLSMPREQDPEINFNWVQILTVLPGASAEDIERLVTDPLEDAIANVSDVRFVASASREASSSILVRFREIPQREFDRRVNDLRREIQNKASAELPLQVRNPQILEITTSNGFPTATVVLVGQANDEVLRTQARSILTDLERLGGVDRVFASGLRDPELHIRFDPQRLAARGLTPNHVADAVSAWFQDTSAGTLRAGASEWLVRLSGQDPDPASLATIPVSSPTGASALLGEVATLERARERASQLASLDGQPAVSFAITKKSYTNTLQLVERLDAYIAQRNPLLVEAGLRLVLADDQTVPTREALSVMQNNAWQGLLMVMGVCWLFLGLKIGALVAIGIPFSLAGTFAILFALGYTLNVSVLLGVVISLGMLVDDAVVVVEAIYYRLERGQKTLQACVDAIREVWAPVLTSVVTTMSAFLPLMLLPGIVGKFMFVIPFVVTLALLVSLLQAYWMLPTHIATLGLRMDRPGRAQRLRVKFNRAIRLLYGRLLVKTMRHPFVFVLLLLVLVAGAVGAFATERVRVQFFAFDPLRIFYVNIDMPPGASLDDTLAEVHRTEALVRQGLRADEVRAVTALAGIKFTETEPLYGDIYGHVMVSLLPRGDNGREVQEVVAAMREPVETLPGPGRRSFLQLEGGPPLTRPINVKIRGDDFAELRQAADAMLAIARALPGARDVTDDDVPGRPELLLSLDRSAVAAAGLDAAQIARMLRLSVDGEVVSVLRSQGDRIEVRVQGRQAERDDIAALLQQPVALPGGGTTTLASLTLAQTRQSRGIIRHYNLRRTITVEGDLDKEVLDTVQANRRLTAGWEQVRGQFPNVDIDLAGELEDIQESLDAMQMLFLLGLGLIYLILAAQFGSYWQPLLILVTVPLAFTGVTFGLLVSNNPLSLYTMYGVIALTGIAVNSAIVLIDAINGRLSKGFPPTHAVVAAARRRIVPVLITSLTTIAGLLSLALGLGGQSLLWGPVASAIVWGLGISTMLTLFVVPVLFRLIVRLRSRRPPTVRPATAPSPGTPAG
jgi:multidrug efflux pump subunit AcrB